MKLALYTVLAVIGLVLVGRFILNPLFRLVGRLGERELFVVAGLFTVVGASAVMHALHLSVPLGAFVAGVMLAESPYRHELESDVEPFRSILLGLFFLSVGMMLDLTLVASRPLLVVGLAAGVIVTKTVLITILSRAFRGSWTRSFRLGLLLSQAGEFGFVLFAQATAAQLVLPGGRLAVRRRRHPVDGDDAVPDAADRLARTARGAQRGRARRPEKSPETSAIVVGYGRFGQTVAQMLQAKGIGVTIIDKKPAQIELSGEFGTKVYYGDGLRLDLLRSAGAESAKVIAFCNDNEGGELSRGALQAVLEAFPQASVMVRAFDRRHVIDLRGLDLVLAERELFESAVVMGKAALRASGIERGEVDGSSGSIGCAIASGSSASRKPATSAPAGRRPSAKSRPLPDEEATPA